MSVKDEPCRQCNALDRYVKGNFSYCRPCHTEAQKRYTENKRLGKKPETKGGPQRSLGFLLTRSAQELKPRCINNHLLSGDNVRLDTQGNPARLLRRCRACERNAKRRTYGLAEEPASTTLTELLDES